MACNPHVGSANALLFSVDLGSADNHDVAIIVNDHPLHSIHDKLDVIVKIRICGEAGGVGLEATLSCVVGGGTRNLEKYIEP